MTTSASLTATRSAWSAFAALLVDADDRDLRRTTRCGGWRVHDLLEHVLWGTAMETEALERAVQGDTTPAIGRRVTVVDAAHGRQLLASRLSALAAAGEATLAAATVARDPAEILVPLQAATVPLPVALDILLLEAGVHADDLRHALTGRSHLEPAEVAAVLTVLPPYLAAAAAGAAHAPPGPVEIRLRGGSVDVTYGFEDGRWELRDEPRAPTVTVTGEDEPIALLLLGRTTADDDRLEVTGARELVADLKRWLPGP